MLTAIMQSPLGPKINSFMRSKTGHALDRVIVRLFDRSLHMRTHSSMVGFPPQPCMMLWVIGRKSGKEHLLIMPYYRVDGKLYLIGTAGGRQKENHWISNLRVTPQCRARIAREHVRLRARFLDDADPVRKKVWDYVSVLVPTVARYQTQTDRLFPVIELAEDNGH
jgi:deazaflavin-dependent oxidoreductase (nitroreductase family)